MRRTEMAEVKEETWTKNLLYVYYIGATSRFGCREEFNLPHDQILDTHFLHLRTQ